MPVVFRYLRMKGCPLAKDICNHTASRLVSSYVPFSVPIKDAVYDCVYNKSGNFAKHFVVQFISYEVTEGVHAVVNKIASTL
jgi:hypothetical protein